MFRQYHSYWMRFDQPDPYDGSYNLSDPQSFNRYAYTQNDPVNFVDPTGLNLEAGGGGGSCYFHWRATGEFVGDTLVGISNFSYTITCSGGAAGGDMPQESQHQTADACGDMANTAQSVADNALYKAGNDTSKALSIFDSRFSKLYAGYPMNNGINIARLRSSGGGGANREVDPYYFGQTNFKSEFMETDMAGNVLSGHHDQTHHFTAMFSGGINRYWLETSVHNRGDNPGDRRLTNAAYDLIRVMS
jgi:hypothetical protein